MAAWCSRAKKEEGRGGGAVGTSAWRREKEERGSAQGRHPDRAVGMAPGSAVGAAVRAHGRGGLGNRGGWRGGGDVRRWGAGGTDRRDGGEAWPGGQRPGCEREREAGQRWGADPGGAVQT
jgi:hypothetical protein